MPKVSLSDPRISALLAAIGSIALTLGGVTVIMTKTEYQCQIDLAVANTRISLLEEAKEACRQALMLYAAPSSVPAAAPPVTVVPVVAPAEPVKVADPAKVVK